MQSWLCTRKRVYYILFKCKLREIYIYGRRKHPFASYPAEKHPKRSKFAITDMQRKPVDFFCCTVRASALTPAIILPTWLLCKSFFPVYKSLFITNKWFLICSGRWPLVWKVFYRRMECPDKPYYTLKNDRLYTSAETCPTIFDKKKHIPPQKRAMLAKECLLACGNCSFTQRMPYLTSEWSM